MFGVYNEQNNCIATLELDKVAFLRSHEQPMKCFNYPNTFCFYIPK